jgi:hypothetical protein
VYFVVADKLEVGELIRFSMEFDDPTGGEVHLDCVGKVVRVEGSGGKSGVAAVITESKLQRRVRN